MTTPKDERTLEEIARKYLSALRTLHHTAMSGEDTTEQEQYVKAIEQEITAHTTALAEEIERLKMTKAATPIFDDRHHAYNQALEHALTIIRKHLSPDVKN